MKRDTTSIKDVLLPWRRRRSLTPREREVLEALAARHGIVEIR